MQPHTVSRLPPVTASSSDLPDTRLGRCVPPVCRPAWSKPMSGVNGAPLTALTMPETCHPETNGVRRERQLVDGARAQAVRAIDQARTVVVALVVRVGGGGAAFERRVARRRVVAARQRVRELRLQVAREPAVERHLQRVVVGVGVGVGADERAEHRVDARVRDRLRARARPVDDGAVGERARRHRVGVALALQAIAAGCRRRPPSRWCCAGSRAAR